MKPIRLGLFAVFAGLFALAPASCSSGGGGGGGGGGFGLQSGCSSYCSKYVGQCGVALTQEDCTNQCQYNFGGVPACDGAGSAAVQCMGAAPVECTSGFPYECQDEISAFIECINCPPTTGGVQPGTVCSAAEEGKEQCWGCKAVLDCRYEDGHFLWRIQQDCEAVGGSCSESSSGSGSYTCY